MIRAALFALLLPLSVSAQEAVQSFAAPAATPDTEIIVRSTTDIAVLTPALNAFVALYPGISITYEQWGSNALYADSRAACEGQIPPADVVFSSGVHQMVDLVNRACASPYVSEITRALPASRTWRDELWGITLEPAVIIYNTALVPAEDAPTTRFALLDLMRRAETPYRGKIATYDVEASGLGFLFAFMDSLEATTFGGLLEGFARTNSVATCCSAEIIDGVASGEYLIAYNVLGSYVSSVPRENIGVIHPDDYTLLLSRAYMIPKTARNKDGAEVLLDFLLSDAGQNILAAGNLVQRPDSDETALSESAQRPIAIDPKLLVAMDRHRRTRFVGQWRSTFGALPAGGFLSAP
ncbi:ABC transporter substrate-binding protein [Loktanella sp. S4079]|uniref:ABC transporter substrate-binding protein n=1 Tax=Loktanella sp. S4079 TaxID=579483 RepID=UPI0005FA35AC|nr:ABC transporter substrate-binding protein [Loktanella sp. S4079]KJZ17988.1 iron-binding protein [Loktanella sp. S4079]